MKPSSTQVNIMYINITSTKIFQQFSSVFEQCSSSLFYKSFTKDIEEYVFI